MLLIAITLCVSLVLLVWSADRFVAGAAGLSYHFGVPPIVVGIVVIGFGTSAPELLISTMSAWQGNSGLALGNAVGSNITNIGLILGVTAFITPIVVAKQTLTREYPVLLLATAWAWLLLSDGHLSFIDGLLLIGMLCGAIIFLAVSAMRAHVRVSKPEEIEGGVLKAFIWTLIGLALLLVSSSFLVDASVELAQLFGVSDLVIGLTIVAIGTSLPELAASVTGALKHHSDLAIGNVVGSNIFNTLGVIGVPGLIHAYDIPAEVLTRDLPIMLFATLLVMLLSFLTCKTKGMHRISGMILLACFVGFEVIIYIQTVGG